MKVLTTLRAMRRQRREFRQHCTTRQCPVVLVPTMGALHRGHESLLRKGRTLAGKDGLLVATIFVNPLQFGPGEDFSRYPRPLQSDLALCRAAGVDLVFTPGVAEMKPTDQSVHVVEESLSTGLCGASRPGHFRGVCTIVAKLFHLVEPDIAVFGKKDFQQLAVIRRMVRDLDFSVKIVGAETVREPDGLALSSRNAYLTKEERAQAPVLHRALAKASAAMQKPGCTAASIRRLVQKTLASATLAVPDYIEIVDTETLVPFVAKAAKAAKTSLFDSRKHVTIALAVRFGRTRLIDHLSLS